MIPDRGCVNAAFAPRHAGAEAGCAKPHRRHRCALSCCLDDAAAHLSSAGRSGRRCVFRGCPHAAAASHAVVDAAGDTVRLPVRDRRARDCRDCERDAAASVGAVRRGRSSASARQAAVTRMSNVVRAPIVHSCPMCHMSAPVVTQPAKHGGEAGAACRAASAGMPDGSRLLPCALVDGGSISRDARLSWR